MSDLIKPRASALGVILAAACCLGLPLLLSALIATGLDFPIHGAILIPLLIAFVAVNLWLLWRTTARHSSRRPFARAWSGCMSIPPWPRLACLGGSPPARGISSTAGALSRAPSERTSKVPA